MPVSPSCELRGAVHIDQMQPQFAATCAANSDGYFPVTGDSAFWLEVRPGIVINRLMDVALKSCDVTPGALITERHYGTLEVHGPDQGQLGKIRRTHRRSPFRTVSAAASGASARLRRTSVDPTLRKGRSKAR